MSVLLEEPKTLPNKENNGHRIPVEQKVAIRVALQLGKSPSAIARHHRIARNTVYAIQADTSLDKSSPQELTTTKNALLNRVWENSYLAQKSINREKLEKSSALQLMTISAIGIEKARLMEGLSTENLSLRSIAQNINSEYENIKSRISELDEK